MKVLFQGDSITDAGRNREDYYDLGPGYPSMVAEILKEYYPEVNFEFINRAISAEQTKDVLKRVQSDIIDLDPDVMIILLGINDTWHHIEDGNWVPNEKYESNYEQILLAAKSVGAKIVMLEQYALPTETTEPFHYDLENKIRVTRKLARKYADCFVPLDGLFASALVSEDSLYWTQEGIHPTKDGHTLIADYCSDAIAELIDSGEIDEK